MNVLGADISASISLVDDTDLVKLEGHAVFASICHNSGGNRCVILSVIGSAHKIDAHIMISNAVGGGFPVLTDRGVCIDAERSGASTVVGASIKRALQIDHHPKAPNPNVSSAGSLSSH
jgi:hypothetical protein